MPREPINYRWKYKVQRVKEQELESFLNEYAAEDWVQTFTWRDSNTGEFVITLRRRVMC